MQANGIQGQKKRVLSPPPHATTVVNCMLRDAMQLAHTLLRIDIRAASFLSDDSLHPLLLPYPPTHYPLPATRTRRVYSGTWDCIVRVARQEGFRGFFKARFHSLAKEAATLLDISQLPFEPRRSFATLCCGRPWRPSPPLRCVPALLLCRHDSPPPPPAPCPRGGASTRCGRSPARRCSSRRTTR